MQLTTEGLVPYIGGQMEIQNLGEGYLYRGEVSAIVVEGTELRAKFAWLAKGKGDGPFPAGWIKADRLDYAASLEIYSVNNIGKSEAGGGDRLCLLSRIVGETVILYPADGSKLDPAKVEGLHLVPA